jgi:hypothetical protein
MTLPDERYHAVRNTEKFLQQLCDPRATPRVPRAIRDRARALLRHYPHEIDLDRMAERSPQIISRHIEPLTRMIMSYEESRDDHAS